MQAGSWRWFQVRCRVCKSWTSSLSLAACRATEALWTGSQRGAAWQTALNPPRRPAFSTPPANRRETEVEMCRKREADRGRWTRGEKKRGVFLLHFTGSQFDFELEADTHYGRAISESPSPNGCSPLPRSLCTKRGGPWGTLLILQWYFCSAPPDSCLSRISAGPKQERAALSLISRPFIWHRGLSGAADKDGERWGDEEEGVLFSRPLWFNCFDISTMRLWIWFGTGEDEEGEGGKLREKIERERAVPQTRLQMPFQTKWV